jgi:hypothetical protein
MAKIYASGNYVIVDDGDNLYEYAKGHTLYVLSDDIFYIKEITQGQYKVSVADLDAGNITAEDSGDVYTVATFTTFLRENTGFKTASGGSGAEWGSITGTLSTQSDLQSALDSKQDELFSGTNIKTVNGNSLLGSGDLVVGGSSGIFGISNSSGVYTYYATLTLAMAAAVAGQTIEMFANVTETGAIEITLKNGVNINGNGYTYTKSTNDSTHLLIITSNISCSINNLTFVRSVGSGRVLSMSGGFTGRIDWTGTILRSTGSGKAAEINGIDTLNLTCISSGAQAVTFISCKAKNCIGIHTGAQIGLDSFGASAYLENCLGESVSSFGLWNSGRAVNCTGVSSSGVGMQTAGTAINCTGTSISGVGFKVFSDGVDVIGCKGMSTSGGGFANGSQANCYDCSGISASSWGTEVTQGSRHHNFTSISTGSYALNIFSPTSDTALTNGNIICRWNNALGYGVYRIPAVIANCYFQLANSSAPYIFNDGTAASFKEAANIYSGGATRNANITNSITNTQDNKGNLTI